MGPLHFGFQISDIGYQIFELRAAKLDIFSDFCNTIYTTTLLIHAGQTVKDLKSEI